MEYHPRHGIHDPTSGTPARRAGSIRRTTTIDMIRPSGLDAELVLIGRGRDLGTGLNGEVSLVGETSYEVVVDFFSGRKVVDLRVFPDAGCTHELLGIAAGSGFRAAMRRVMPLEPGSLLYQLLDDLPVATLISGFALLRAGVPIEPQAEVQQADICAGWRSGGTIMAAIHRTGRSPAPTGPAAPSLLDSDDALAWHQTPELPPDGMRRWRRLDVAATGDRLEIDTMFRDTHMNEAVQTVVHEYALAATVDRRSGRALTSEATPRVLPWQECPAAAASASRLVGRTLAGIRDRVRSEFTGIETCTHLNDLLRSLADVTWLARHLPDGPG